MRRLHSISERQQAFASERPGFRLQGLCGPEFFRATLDEIHSAYPIDRVIYAARRPSGDAAHAYRRRQAILMEWCERHGIPCEAIPIGAIKQFATGRRIASRRTMVDTVRSRWGVQTKTPKRLLKLAGPTRGGEAAGH